MKVVGKVALLTAVILMSLQINAQPLGAQKNMPKNIGQNLQRLVELYRKDPQAAFSEMKAAQKMHRMQHDAKGERPLVSIYLDGKVPLEQVAKSLQQEGFTVTATNPSFAKGIIEGYMPLSKVEEIAQMPGIFSINPVSPPANHVGKASKQSVE